MTRIGEVLRRIPNWVEFFVVTLLCFGIPIIRSFLSFSTGESSSAVAFTDERAILLIVYEITISAICIAFLYLRGYRIWETVRLSPSKKGSFFALGLFLSAYACYVVLFNIVYLLAGPENFQNGQYTITMAFPTVVAVALINPLFEEVFVVAYLFDRLEKFDVVSVVFISALIRVSYHLYQGWTGIISILPLGLIFAVAYWKTKNLWPLVLAHALMDLIGLLPTSS